VSLAKVVWDIAKEMMESKGFNDNFSAYVADLVRRDKEREEAKQATHVAISEKLSSSPYPSHQPQLNEVRERPTTAAPPPAKKKKAA
jgi:hypothetical protein